MDPHHIYFLIIGLLSGICLTMIAAFIWANSVNKTANERHEEDKEFREELLGYHRDAGVALRVRNELTRELIKAVREK